MTNNKIVVFIICILVFEIYNLPYALAKGTGSSAGITLLRPVSARSAAMGEAYTAFSGDVESLHYNPAGLSSLVRMEILTMFQRGFDDDTFASIVIGKNLASVVLGASIQYYDTGKIELVDLSGRDVSKTGQKDMIGNLGIGIPLKKNFAAGLNIKGIFSEVFGVKASAFAVDAGVQYHGLIDIGLAIQNFGSDLTYVNKGDPLPKTVTIGTAYTHHFTKHALTLAIDVPYHVNEEETMGLMGLEYSFEELFNLRAGYQLNLTDFSRADENNISAGIGFNLGNYAFDYAIGITENLSNPHYVSVKMKF